jgi:hypothetical protein
MGAISVGVNYTFGLKPNATLRQNAAPPKRPKMTPDNIRLIQMWWEKFVKNKSIRIWKETVVAHFKAFDLKGCGNQ